MPGKMSHVRHEQDMCVVIIHPGLLGIGDHPSRSLGLSLQTNEAYAWKEVYR